MEDPKKPTPKELEAANRFAKLFARRKGLINPESFHVGENGAPFIDAATGKNITGVKSALPYGTITNITRIPYYVKDLEWDSHQNLPFYIDEKTGDMQYVHPDIFRSSRFRKPSVEALSKSPIPAGLIVTK